MPRLVRLYIVQSCIGFGIAAAFTALLLWANVANLWHLVTHTSEGPLAAFLLFMFNGIVFSGVQFGIAIMRMSERDDDGRGRRDPIPLEAPVPIPVRETHTRRR